MEKERLMDAVPPEDASEEVKELYESFLYTIRAILLAGGNVHVNKRHMIDAGDVTLVRINHPANGSVSYRIRNRQRKSL